MLPPAMRVDPSKVRAKVAALAALALACTWPSSAQASPEDVLGYGPRSSAMGGTGVAFESGFDAAYHNPALLSGARVRTLTLGFQGATFDLRARGEGLPGRVSEDPARGVIIGVGVPVPFGGVLRDRVGVGLAFYTPTDILVRGRLLSRRRRSFPSWGIER